MAYPSPPSPHRMANGAALFFHLALVLIPAAFVTLLPWCVADGSPLFDPIPGDSGFWNHASGFMALIWPGVLVLGYVTSGVWSWATAKSRRSNGS